MISIKNVKRYCKEYWLIENYDQAMADNLQVWHCHHRKEISLNMNSRQLKENELYFNVHYSELIFLTPEEHHRLHAEGENNPNYGKEGYWKGKTGPNKGKPKSEEWKQNMGVKMNGINNPNYKYHITKDELYDMYIIQDLYAREIADMYNCSLRCIEHKLKKYGISKKN